MSVSFLNFFFLSISIFDFIFFYFFFGFNRQKETFILFSSSVSSSQTRPCRYGFFELFNPSFLLLSNGIPQVRNHLHIDLAGAILPRTSPDYLDLRHQLRAALFNSLATSPDTFGFMYVTHPQFFPIIIHKPNCFFSRSYPRKRVQAHVAFASIATSSQTSKRPTKQAYP